MAVAAELVDPPTSLQSYASDGPLAETRACVSSAPAPRATWTCGDLAVLSLALRSPVSSLCWWHGPARSPARLCLAHPTCVDIHDRCAAGPASVALPFLSARPVDVFEAAADADAAAGTVLLVTSRDVGVFSLRDALEEMRPVPGCPAGAGVVGCCPELGLVVCHDAAALRHTVHPLRRRRSEASGCTCGAASESRCPVCCVAIEPDYEMGPAVFADRKPRQQATRVFRADDRAGRPLLCVFSSADAALVAVSVMQGSGGGDGGSAAVAGTKAFAVSAVVDAVPVVQRWGDGTRTLVAAVSVSGTLSVLIEGTAVAEVDARRLLELAGIPASGSEVITCLRDPVEDRVTVRVDKGQNGLSYLRVTLKVVPEEELTSRCLAAAAQEKQEEKPVSAWEELLRSSEHYRSRSNPCLKALWVEPPQRSECEQLHPCPERRDVMMSLLMRMHLVITNSGTIPAFPTVPGITEFTRKVCKLYNTLFAENRGSLAAAEQAVLAMVEEGMSQKDIECIPPGIAVALVDACSRCREDVSSHWPVEVFKLLSRDDLVMQSKKETIPMLEAPWLLQSPTAPLPVPPPLPTIAVALPRHLLLLQRAKGITPAAGADAQKTSQTPQQQKPALLDGTECSDPIVALLFDKDDRFTEARRLLQSRLRVQIPLDEDGSEAEWLRQHQLLLSYMAQRTVALPVARGALALSLDHLVGTDSLVFPEILVDGRNTSGHDITLDPSVRPGMRCPAFHNGVACALRIAPGSEITNAWITAQKPKQLTDEFAGFLFGLGLQGHLPLLPTVCSRDLLHEQHEPTSIAVLLGLAAARAGTMDWSIMKTLCVHIPSLYPPRSQALESVTVPVQIASLLGIGILCRGKAYRRVLEALLGELSSPPDIGKPYDRTCYALAAGLGLGLNALAKGHTIVGSEDLCIPDRLISLCQGGPIVLSPFEKKQQQAGATSGSDTAPQSQQASLYYANGIIDTSTVAPGAIAALALIFLRTASVSVCKALKIPESAEALLSERPDLLGLRTVAHALVMWHSIASSDAWVKSQVPASLYRNSTAHAEAREAITAGACVALGLRFAGTADAEAKATLLKYLKQFMAPLPPPTSVADRMRRCSHETHTSNIALALAIVMSGTGDVEAMRVLRSLHFRVGEEINYGHHMARNMAMGFLFLGGGKLTFSTSVESVAMLLCSVFPIWPLHSSDERHCLQAFRHLYVLAAQCRCVVSCDVDTKQLCRTDISVCLERAPGLQQPEVLQLTTPCLLPELSTIKSIVVDSDQYFKVPLVTEGNGIKLARVGASLMNPSIVYVKRRLDAGADDDCGAIADSLVEIDPLITPSTTSPLLAALLRDDSVRSFVEMLRTADSRSKHTLMTALESALEQRRPELLAIAHQLWTSCGGGSAAQPADPQAVADVVLATLSADSTPSLCLCPDVVAALEARCRSYVRSAREHLKRYTRSDALEFPGDAGAASDLACAIEVLRLPSSAEAARAYLAAQEPDTTSSGTATFMSCEH
eukprot:m51a1_g11976 anaphase promoting complex subunit 1 (1501) ;mRNA; r:840808-846266